MKKIGLIIISVMFLVPVHAQEVWDFQRCIDHAMANSITIKQYELNSQSKENNLQQAKNNRLPDLNANISQSLSFGQSLTIKNTYESFTSSNTGLGANSSVIIYQGLSLRNTIKMHEFNLKASFEELQKAKDDVTLNIASAYLEILFAKELLSVAEDQVERTKIQLERSKKMVEAGKIAEGTLLEIESQLAREELDVVTYQNNLQITLLNLSQLLELDSYNQFDIETPEIPEIQAETSIAIAKEVFDKAVLMRPEIKNAEYALKGSEMQLKVAKSYTLPTISASASLYDQYLANIPDNMPNFVDQLGDNHRESVGFNVNIPIFNKFQAKTNIANSKLQIENDQLILDRTKKELRMQIEKAYTQATAAHKKFLSNRSAVRAMQESFRYVEEKFNTGLVNSVEYNDSKTKLTAAESNLLQAKYEFIFRTKILDFYSGTPIEL